MPRGEHEPLLCFHTHPLRGEANPREAVLVVELMSSE